MGDMTGPGMTAPPMQGGKREKHEEILEEVYGALREGGVDTTKEEIKTELTALAERLRPHVQEVMDVMLVEGLKIVTNPEGSSADIVFFTMLVQRGVDERLEIVRKMKT